MRSTRSSNKNVREFAQGDKWVISIMNLNESIASRIVRKTADSCFANLKIIRVSYEEKHGLLSPYT